MAIHPIASKRILELGCGLDPATPARQRSGADIVASDHHPLAASFLAYNAAPNDLPAVPLRTSRWDIPHQAPGVST